MTLLAYPSAPDLDSYPPLLRVSRCRCGVDLPSGRERCHWCSRAPLRSEPCACGQAVVQLVGEDVLHVVERHQRTIEHAEWRRERGL